MTTSWSLDLKKRGLDVGSMSYSKCLNVMDMSAISTLTLRTGLATLLADGHWK